MFEEGELVESATTEEYSVVQTEGRRRVRRRIKHYNLDAILSVGYRVSSRRGTQFRIWATRTLREHLQRGFTMNERRLAERGLGEIEQTVGLLARTLTAHSLVTDEGRAVLDVVERYTRAWRLLLEYDEERLAEHPARPVAPAKLTLDEARAAAAELRADLGERGEAGPLSSDRSAATRSPASSAPSNRPSTASRSIRARRRGLPRIEEATEGRHRSERRRE